MGEFSIKVPTFIEDLARKVSAAAINAGLLQMCIFKEPQYGQRITPSSQRMAIMNGRQFSWSLKS
jgi:hypothetical protein